MFHNQLSILWTGFESTDIKALKGHFIEFKLKVKKNHKAMKKTRTINSGRISFKNFRNTTLMEAYNQQW